MSKAQKIIMALITLVVIGGGAFFILKSTNNNGFEKKEISIKQAEVGKVESRTYEDYAGFSFDYPGEFGVQEIELDDKTIYSSLEIKSPEGEKVTLKVFDTKIENLDDWQAMFEEKNVIISIKDAFFSDIEAKTVIFGAPKEIKTIAVEDGIIYELTSLADGGYYEKVHEEIINSFEFKAEVFEDEPTGSDPEGEDDKSINEEIVLIEEIVD